MLRQKNNKCKYWNSCCATNTHHHSHNENATRKKKKKKMMWKHRRNIYAKEITIWVCGLEKEMETVFVHRYKCEKRRKCNRIWLKPPRERRDHTKKAKFYMFQRAEGDVSRMVLLMSECAERGRIEREKPRAKLVTRARERDTTAHSGQQRRRQHSGSRAAASAETNYSVAN